MSDPTRSPGGAFELVEPEARILLARRVGDVTGPEMGWYLDAIERAMEEAEQPIALLWDAGVNPKGRPDAEARKLAGDFLRTRAELFRAKSTGMDFVFRNRVSRGILTAILWMAPPPVICRVHPTLDLALEAARRRLSAPDVAARSG